MFKFSDRLFCYSDLYIHGDSPLLRFSHIITQIRIFALNLLIVLPQKFYLKYYKYISKTETKTGLRVRAVLVDKIYEKGLKASKSEIESLNIERHEVNPAWNYTLYPK
jgi:hypothetical protein